MLGLTNLCFAVIPWITDAHPGSFDTWAPVAGRLLGAAGLAVGAWTGSRWIDDAPRAAGRAIAVVVAGLLLIGLLGAVLAPHLPVGIDPDLAPNPSGPELVGAPGLLVCQVISALLYTFAAFGFAARAERTGDELTGWFAAAATVAAFARLNYFLFPSINSEWVYTGDFLRMGFYVLILVGAVREIATYQGELADLRVDRERRRIARDLHDGLAQELAFIVGQAGRLHGSENDPSARISSAAERALAEARHAIATLSRPAGGTLDASVALAAEEVASRNGVQLQLELAPGVEAADKVHQAVARIVREAVSNAIRHGEAKVVRVELAERDGLRVAVEDDGTGIGSSGEKSAGFGLVSMRERAEALGGTMQVGPGAEGGTRVDIWLP
jgi:signal transduction histidine kinase